MSIETLKRRVNRIATHIGPSEPEQVQGALFVDRSVFTAQELAELDALLEQIEPKLQLEHDKRRMFEHLSSEELDTLYTWGTLYKSRKEEGVTL